MVAPTRLNMKLYVHWLTYFFFTELKGPEYTLHIKHVANASGDRVRHITETECSSMFENVSSYIKLCLLDATHSSLADIMAVVLTLVDSNEEGTRNTTAEC